MSSMAFTIGAARYPVLLPSIRDARLHLAAVIVSLQVLGQVAFDFRLSIAQMLISVGTCAVLEVAITFRQQRVLMWPASALLTGNGVAFVLRVPGTEHGDWWSLHGGWVFAATAAVALLSKHVIRVGGAHVFNPSNIGLVICFLVLGSQRAEPLDFWWGPLSTAMALALAIIVVGGLVILTRLRLLLIAVSFWGAFVAAIAVVAATGHAMSARWHLGPVGGFRFWEILATSPEILVFLFFMITDPKTTPRGTRARIVFGVSVGLVAALFVAPARTEFWAKVGVLGALAIVCLLRVAIGRLPRVAFRPRAIITATVAAAGLVGYLGALVLAGIPARPAPAATRMRTASAPLPQIVIQHSKGVDAPLQRRIAEEIAADVAADAALGRQPITLVRRITLWLEPGAGQGPLLVAQLEGVGAMAGQRRALSETVEIVLGRDGWRIGRVRASQRNAEEAP
jgi:Na+-translocating ferredoxin:NAD+ oxidoreductase RnfD subunit